MGETTKSSSRAERKAAAARVRSYIDASYARLSGDYDLPLPEMGETATNDLRLELSHALESRKMVGREALLSVDFDLDDMEVTPSGDELLVRCVERYALEYEADDPIARQARGARQHQFVLRTTDMVIQSHVANEMNAAEIDAMSARRDTEAASQRQKDQADKKADEQAANYRPPKPPSSPREKAKLAFVIAVFVGFTMLGIYQGGPRTREVQISLHTGERRVLETRLGVDAGDSYTPAACTDWATKRLGVPREEQRWLQSSYVYRGWFGIGNHSEEKTQVTIETIQALYALQRLDRRDTTACNEAITRYKALVPTLKPTDFPDSAGAPSRPGEGVALASTSPLTSFIKTIQ